MKTILLAAALLVAPHAAAPAAPADYAGKWALDQARSTNLPPYYARIKSHRLDITETPEHLDVKVEVDLGQGEPDRMDLDYRLDGAETSTTMPMRMQGNLVQVPTKVKAAVADNGDVHITITRELPLPSGAVTAVTTEDWHLSPDHATLTVHRVDDTPRGRMESDMVFAKS